MACRFPAAPFGRNRLGNSSWMTSGAKNESSSSGPAPSDKRDRYCLATSRMLTSGTLSSSSDSSIDVLADANVRSAGPSALREPRGQSERVLEVQFLQHRIRQIDSIQLPERVVVAVVVEVLVLRLEDPPVVRVLFGLKRILAEEQAVLVLDEEVVREARLASD